MRPHVFEVAMRIWPGPRTASTAPAALLDLVGRPPGSCAPRRFHTAGEGSYGCDTDN